MCDVLLLTTSAHVIVRVGVRRAGKEKVERRAARKKIVGGREGEK